MKLSISNIAWSEENDDRMYHICSAMGYHGLEVAPSRIWGEFPFQNIEKALQFRKMIKDEYDLEISSLQSIWYGQKGFLFKEDYERFCQYTHEAIQFAGRLKVNNLVFGSPKIRKIFHVDDYWKGMDFLNRAAEWAKENNTIFSIEANPAIYGTNYINYTLEALALAKSIHSKHLKVNLDIGTIIVNQEDIEEIENNIEWINHVHISEPNLRPIETREIHKEVFNILRNGNYNGYVSIEMGKQDNIENIVKIMEYVQEL